MAVASLMRGFLQSQITGVRSVAATVVQSQVNRNVYTYKKLPQPGVDGRSFRRIVHFEEKYTVKPLKITNLGGRDPVSGRVIAHCIGGGVKHPYHWINWVRDGPTDLKVPPVEEKVLSVFKDGNRTAFVALVGRGKELKYILATENMKPGDLIKTHRGIPPNPIRPKEGDTYALAALPIGTVICCVEKYPGLGGTLVHAAGSCATVAKKLPNGRMLVRMPSKKQFSLPGECVAVVGRLSNVEHGTTPIGSPQKNRELGNRPRSGLKKKKTGRFGRKIRTYNKVIEVSMRKKPSSETLALNLGGLN